MEFQLPHIIHFKQIGASDTGFISIAENNKQIPFSIQRVFWTYYTPQSLKRGTHAHHQTEQVLIAVNGTIEVETELPDGTKNLFSLNSPDIGVYIPPNAWHIMHYSHSAVQMVLASTLYDEKDYIRDYAHFKQIWKT